MKLLDFGNFLCMFQHGGKFYLNVSNWKRYQQLNYTNNNNKDRYRDIDNPTTQRDLKKFSCHLKHLNRLKKTTKSNSQKTGLRKAASIYSVSSVKERLANEAGSNTGIDIYRFKQKMANTLSVMTNVLRNVVSKQRIRYKEKGFNLDLAYVCDNIIAMGYPADNYESMYRNPLGDVYKFLEDNHHDHYKIYNLCLERSYDITKFHGRVSVYPFEDHNPPTIELILKFCDDVDNWLKADTLNVAAVHCKAGKGRTGTMICCYLLYSGQQRTAEDALACYDEKRTKDRKGVTIPSQRRYVQYFSKLMRLGLPYERRSLQFCEIRFSKANTLHSQGTVHCSISVLQDKVQQLQNFPIDFRKNSVLDMKNPPLPVAGDIKVELTKNTKKIFHFWFNTFFVTDSSVIEGEGNDVKFVYTLQKWEIDDVHKDKCYPEDFKVELVFYVDDSNVDRDHMKVSCSNRLTSNHRTTMQNAGAVRMSSQHQQQSNNYSLPQNNSSGSEMNFLCDQKSSSSTSVSSSLGVGGGTDTSNGYESIRSTTQRKSGAVQQTFSNHHSNHYMSATDVVNNSVVFSAPNPAQQQQQHMTLPPSYMEQHQPQHHQLQQQQQHKNNMPQQKTNQLQQKNLITLSSTTNQRHLQRQVASGGGGGGDVHAHHPNNMDAATCLPSTNLNANKSSSNSSSSNNSTNNMASNSYNHNHHNHSNNSSKTSSVSSQSSSSAIGDNEEDWESGESQAKQLEHITLLLSTSSITNPTSTLPPPPTHPPSSTTTSPSNQPATPSNTTTPTSFPNTVRSCKNLNRGISNSSQSSSYTSASASNCPSNNKSKTSNSSCTNRVVGGDDDDNDKNKNNDDDRKLKFKKFNSNHVVNPVPNTTTDTNTKSVEFNVGDNNITSSIASEADQTALVPATSIAPSTPNNRPKLMHLLMAPKNMQQQQSPHKPIFKRKSSYKLVKGSNSNGSTFAGVDCSDDSLASSTALAAGSGGGVAITSKLKLKIKLKKNKLKLSQKFQWFQNYFRTDPVDFCENFVQQTTSMRRNSMCSMASRTHKLSTTTPPSVTPPPPVVNAGSSCEQLDRATSVNSVSTSNASIATGDLCEDYYSSICDNQLSFSNSPCKSPRTMADMASSISGGAAGGGGVSMSHGSSFGSSFARSAGVSNSYLRERRETLPGCSSHANNRRTSNNVVIVAAKPAKIHAIGFNVKTTNLARQDSFETNGEDEESPASIYYTPCSALIPTTGDANDHTNTAFVFPQIHESEKALDNVDQKLSINNISTAGSISKPQAKYSLNLVIVKECAEPPPAASEIAKPTSAASNNESDGIDSDCCDISQKRIDEHRLQDDIGSVTLSEELEMGKITATTTAASVCSNSSSSGFCTSECCTTNSSSSSCNCNPFAMDLERHVASAKQDQQQNTIREVIEATTNDENDNEDDTTKNETNANVAELLKEVSFNSNKEGSTSTTDKCDQQ